MDNDHLEDWLILGRKDRAAEFWATLYTALILEFVYRVFARFEAYRISRARRLLITFAERYPTHNKGK